MNDIIFVIAFTIIACTSVYLVVMHFVDAEMEENRNLILNYDCEHLNYKLTIDKYSWKKTSDFAKEQYEQKCLESINSQ